MKILTGPLYVSRESHSWSLSSLEDYDDDVTRSYSWEPTERQNSNMGLHGRSLCWSLGWIVGEHFTGLNHLFVEMDLMWLDGVRSE